MPNKPNLTAARIGYLKKVLERDKMRKGKRPWVAFDTTLRQISQDLRINLVREIRKHRQHSRDRNYIVLDLGAGSGKTASESQIALNNSPHYLLPGDRERKNPISIIATGLRRKPEWNTHQNSKSINWIPTEFESLSKKIPHNSVNFIYSNFGVGHAENLKKALEECMKVLKKGGRIIYSYNIHHLGSPQIPEGLRPVKKNPIIFRQDPHEDSEMATIVVYLEKV